MSDLASFNTEVILNIFGIPRCLLSGHFEIQGHHITGRGSMKNPESRKMHSSPFNYAPLSPDIHAYAPLHCSELQNFFLRIAGEKVMYAIMQNRYELTELDLLFLQKYQPQHPLLSVQ